MNPNVTGICWNFSGSVFSGISRALQSGSTGSGEFEQIYRRLYHVLHKLRGDAPFPLLHQTKTRGGRYQLISRLTVKHIFCGGVVVLALFYLFYLLRLDSQTQDILHQLNKLLR